MVIGVLALQGDFEKHQDMLSLVDVESIQVRYPAELDACDGLIIPGGESTTLTKQIAYSQLREPLISFAKERPVFGTCAGMIMMADDVDDPRVHPLGLLRVSIHRNGWGRQVHSSTETIALNIPEDDPFQATFIRAPEIVAMGENVSVLGSYGQQPVLIQSGHLLASSFHPELGTDTRIHNYFRRLVHV